MTLGYHERVIENGTAQPGPRDWRDWMGLVARLVLGGSLLVAGLLHVMHLERNVLSVRAFRILPWSLTTVVGYAQPIVEILLGLLIIVGLFTRVVAAIGVLAMVVFIAAIASVWARGLSIDCGCFSQGGATDNPHYLRDIIRDTIFALCGLWLVWRPRSILSLDGWVHRPVHTPYIPDADDEDALVGEDIHR